MSDKEEKVKRDIEKRIDESKRQKEHQRDYSDRDITRVQRPEQWPDPPAEKEDD